jgi:hypothetical protein
VIKRNWASHLPELDRAINTGLRKGSQYGLTWDMGHWKVRMLNIPRTKNEEPVDGCTLLTRVTVRASCKNANGVAGGTKVDFSRRQRGL